MLRVYVGRVRYNVEFETSGRSSWRAAVQEGVSGEAQLSARSLPGSGAECGRDGTGYTGVGPEKRETALNWDTNMTPPPLDGAPTRARHLYDTYT